MADKKKEFRPKYLGGHGNPMDNLKRELKWMFDTVTGRRRKKRPSENE